MPATQTSAVSVMQYIEEAPQVGHMSSRSHVKCLSVGHVCVGFRRSASVFARSPSNYSHSQWRRHTSETDGAPRRVIFAERLTCWSCDMRRARASHLSGPALPQGRECHRCADPCCVGAPSPTARAPSACPGRERSVSRRPGCDIGTDAGVSWSARPCRRRCRGDVKLQ